MTETEGDTYRGRYIQREIHTEGDREERKKQRQRRESETEII